MSNKHMYTSIPSLRPVEKLVVEASTAVSDPSRTMSDDHEINEALAAAGGIVCGGGIGYAALFYGGSVVGLSAAGITSGLAAAGAVIGGGMVAGIAVLAAPAILLGIGGYALTSHCNKRKLLERKEVLLQAAMRKQNAVISELTTKTAANQERIDYLTRLNTLLQAAIDDLRHDLGGYPA